VTKTLPKGHVSCLSNAFRYTPASHTDLRRTFARIEREARVQSKQDLASVYPLPIKQR